MLSVPFASACWQYCNAPVLQPSFLCICQVVFQRYFSVKSHLKYLRNYKSRKLSFACISSLMVLNVLDQLVTSFPRAITDYGSL